VPRRSPFVIELSRNEREALEIRSRRYTSPYRDVVRAKIVLMAAEGLENKTIASRLDLPFQVVSKWRKRFFEQRMAGLEERSRAGRTPVFPPRVGGRRQGDRV
jgi:transposase-like protein